MKNLAQFVRWAIPVISCGMLLASTAYAQGGIRVAPGTAVESRRLLTNESIVQMVKQGEPDPAIIAAIRANPVKFDLSRQQRLALHHEGVSEQVLNAMVTAELRRRKGLGAAVGPNAGELSPQPYPPKSKVNSAGQANEVELSPQPYPPKNGTLLTPGAQHTMLVTQANSPSGDGNKSSLLPAVQRPAIRNGTMGDGSVRPATPTAAEAQTGNTTTPSFLSVTKTAGDTAVQSKPVTLSRSAAAAAQTGNTTTPSFLSVTKTAEDTAVQSKPVTLSQSMGAQGNASSKAGPASAPSKVHEQHKYEAITLQRGTTQDKAFSTWANSAQGSAGSNAGPAPVLSEGRPMRPTLPTAQTVHNKAAMLSRKRTTCQAGPPSILAVNGLAIYPFGAAGTVIDGDEPVVGETPPTGNVFTAGKRYVITGCNFGATPGQVYLLEGGVGGRTIKLYPHQAPSARPLYETGQPLLSSEWGSDWSDTRIDAVVDPSARKVESQEGVVLVVVTSTGKAYGFGWGFAP